MINLKKGSVLLLLLLLSSNSSILAEDTQSHTSTDFYRVEREDDIQEKLVDVMTDSIDEVISYFVDSDTSKKLEIPTPVTLKIKKLRSRPAYDIKGRILYLGHQKEEEFSSDRAARLRAVHEYGHALFSRNTNNNYNLPSFMDAQIVKGFWDSKERSGLLFRRIDEQMDEFRAFTQGEVYSNFTEEERVKYFSDFEAESERISDESKAAMTSQRLVEKMFSMYAELFADTVAVLFDGKLDAVAEVIISESTRESTQKKAAFRSFENSIAVEGFEWDGDVHSVFAPARQMMADMLLEKIAKGKSSYGAFLEQLLEILTKEIEAILILEDGVLRSKTTTVKELNTSLIEKLHLLESSVD